jgi:hypothetical protein
LDLTFDLAHSEYRGYISTTPTLVDIDNDGFLDIIVGTQVGFVYAINHQGKLHDGGFPFVMDAIFAEIVAEDVTGDGKLGMNL